MKTRTLLNLTLTALLAFAAGAADTNTAELKNLSVNGGIEDGRARLIIEAILKGGPGDKEKLVFGTTVEETIRLTREKITLPNNIAGWLSSRSRFARLGLMVHISAPFMQPGISNHQVLEISNFGHLELEIFPSTPVCQFVFQRTEGHGAYEGIYHEQTPETFWRD